VRLRDAVERGEPFSNAAAAAGIFTPLVLADGAGRRGKPAELVAAAEESLRILPARGPDFRLRNLTHARALAHHRGRRHGADLALGVFLPMWNMIGKSVTPDEESRESYHILRDKSQYSCETRALSQGTRSIPDVGREHGTINQRAKRALEQQMMNP